MIAQIQMRRGTSAVWAEAEPVVLAAGEMGLDTTIQKSKIGDGTTEWASLPWLNGGVTNSNLLHDWDFRNPVNQREVTGAISTGSYFFDRWMRNSGTVTVAAGYLTMASGAVIEQRIEGLYLAGETVTVSVKVGSNIHSGTGVFPTAAGTVGITLTGFGTATLGYNAGYMFVRFTASGSQNVVSVKCELGTVSTVHLDPPMDYGAELVKCQRYFTMLGNTVPCFGFPNSATDAGMSIPISATLRMGTPSLYVSGDSYLFTPSGTAIGIVTFSNLRSLPGMLYFNASVAGGLTQFSSVTGYLAAGGTAYVSADL